MQGPDSGKWLSCSDPRFRLWLSSPGFEECGDIFIWTSLLLREELLGALGFASEPAEQESTGVLGSQQDLQ